MTRRDIKLIQSLVDYVNDVKPYHTKLRDFTSELFFEDTVHVGMIDEYSMQLYHQNVWGREHVAGYLLFNVGSGTEGDRTFRIPATVIPRFSVTSDDDQTPPGDDPADVSDRETAEDDFSYSYQVGIDDQIPARAAVVEQYPIPNWVDFDDVPVTYDYNVNLAVRVDTTEEDLYGWADPVIIVDGVVYGGNYTRNDDLFTLTGTTVAGVAGENYLLMHGVDAAGEYAVAPDNAAIDIVGDIDIIAKAAANDWTPALDRVFISKFETTDNQRSWRFGLVATTGRLRLVYSVNGTAEITSSSTVSPVVVDGADLWVRVTVDVDDGGGNHVVTFYTSADGSIWTMLGTAVTTAGVIALYSSTAALAVGGYSTGALGTFDGKIYYTEVKSGIAGTSVAKFDARTARSGALNLFSSSTGETYRMYGGAAIAGTYVAAGTSGFTGTITPSVDDLLNLPSWPGVNDELWVTYSEAVTRRRVEVFFTTTHRYHTPFHQGSRVSVNAVSSVLGTDYFVDNTRSFIQFSEAAAPAQDDELVFDLLKTDRLFISIQHPFDYLIYRDYDDTGYDTVRYDTNDDDPSGPEADYFLLTINDSATDDHDAVFFYNSSIDTPKAGMTVDNIYDAASHDGEVWKITAIAPWKFTVQRIEPTESTPVFAYFKEAFDNGVIAFTIDNTWSDYYITAEPTSYGTEQPLYATSPIFSGIGTGAMSLPETDAAAPFETWTVTATSTSTFTVVGSVSGAQADATVDVPYDNGIVSFTITQSNVGSWQSDFEEDDYFVFDVEGVTETDPTDHLMNINLVTEHGVVTDPASPAHAPIELIPYGKIMLKEETIDSGVQDYYAFVLNSIPPVNTYVELRVEQNGQLNSFARTNMDEVIQITEIPADNSGARTRTITTFKNGAPREIFG